MVNNSPSTEDACVENPPAEVEAECPKRPTPLQRRGKRKRPGGETDDFSKVGRNYFYF